MICFVDVKKGLYLYLLCCLAIIIYMLILYFISHEVMPDKAKGSLIYDDQGNVRGSMLLAQNFKSNKYFKGRIGSTYDTRCDVAMYSDVFRNALNNRYKNSFYKGDVIMITPSNSRIDPYITRDEAIRQAPSVAKSRGVELDEVLNLVDELTLYSVFPFFQLDIVNTTRLNAMLDYGSVAR